MTGPLPDGFRRPVEVTVDPNTTVELAPGLQVAHHYDMSIDLLILDQREPAQSFEPYSGPGPWPEDGVPLPEPAPRPVPLYDGGRLVSWVPRWTPPVVRSACPSCGRVDERAASNWTGRPGSVRVTLSCRPGPYTAERECWRTWDERVSVPAEPSNPELWR